MRLLFGIGLLLANVIALTFLRPRNGQERWLVRFPGAWIIVGLLLTISFACAAGLILTGVL